VFRPFVILASSILRKEIVRRVARVLLISGVLILVARPVAEAVAPVLFILLLIPTEWLLVLTVLVAGISLFVLRQSRALLWGFLIFLISQALILTAWLLGWTAESAFNRWRQDDLLATGRAILDPQLEWVLMNLFWIGAAFVLAIAIEILVYPYLSRESGYPSNSRRPFILLLLFEGFIVVALTFSSVNYRRSFFKASVSSTAPDAKREIRLVPMNAFFDRNGLVISRKPGALVWRTVAGIGDLLSESHAERFVWADHDSKAYLLFQVQGREVPVMGFDFATNERVDLRSYREQP
jgi:hypothetical protein